MNIEKLKQLIEEIQKWSNANEGYGALIMFILTLIFAWITGIFQSIIKKPKMKVVFLDKMSFYSHFDLGVNFFNEADKKTYPSHKTAFVIYIKIANIGNAPTSVEQIFLGYKKQSTIPFIKKYLWLPQFHAGQPFTIPLNKKTQDDEDNVLVIPTLFEGSPYKDSDSFLEMGKYTIGTAYFEQPSSWGQLYPTPINDKEDIKVTIKIKDIYSKHYYFKTVLRKATIDEARRYNPNFGIADTIFPNI